MSGGDCWVDVNGVSLRYRLSGTGPRTLVLVHEMGGTLESWDGVIPWVSGEHQVLTFDLRGSGMSERLHAQPTLDDLTQDLAELLTALRIAAPVSLAGCAVGARIALAFAARFADRAAAVVAMSPSLDVGAAKAQAALATIERIERLGIKAAMREPLQRWFAPPLAMDPRADAYVLRYAANDAVSYGAMYRMLLSSHLDDNLGSIRCPCLILAGDLDSARPPDEIAAAAARIPDATFRLLHSGHFMHLQTPELVGAQLQQFLRASAAHGGD
ncbi:MAG: alpha/beta fold hydrolase [Burkholderiales bacterium]|nr:alpha/beta fold hydrolase [Burkholderiales bacterium]